MASLMFSMASSNVSPWLWQPGRAGQWTSLPYSVLFMTTVYFMFLTYHIHPYLSKNEGDRNLTYPYVYAVSFATKNIIAMIDSGNQIAETNEGNNRAVIRIP